MTELVQSLAAVHASSAELSVKHGDVIVITTQHQMAQSQADALAAYVKREVGDGIRILILTDGVQLSVIHRD